MKISIVTINRNNADGLQRTIESVVSQIDDNFEYIVIDGASTDESVDIIKKYSDKIDYWISEPDGGIYNAMNKGILRAKGEYCLFLNSGDWFVKDIFNKINFQYFCYDIVYGNIIVEYKNGLKSIRKGCAKDEITFFDLYNDTICHQAAFIRRRLFDEYGLYNENFKIASDWVFFIKTIIFGNAKIKYIDVNISHFDGHGISQISDIEERKIALESLFPAKVIMDYEAMNNLNKQFQNSIRELEVLKNRYSLLEKLRCWLKVFR